MHVVDLVVRLKCTCSVAMFSLNGTFTPRKSREKSLEPFNSGLLAVLRMGPWECCELESLRAGRQYCVTPLPMKRNEGQRICLYGR